MKSIQVVTLALFLAAVSVSGAIGRDQAARSQQPRQDYTSGAYLYKMFCASCHGESGKGDGPVSDMLRDPPGDLTLITKRAGGVYPRDQVQRAIDGRSLRRGHTADGMRAWADVLRTTEGNDEATIAKRIEALVSHIESIQVKND